MLQNEAVVLHGPHLPPVTMTDEREKQLGKELSDCVMGSPWFCVAGLVLAIPLGVRSKSYMPVLYLGVAGTVLDLVTGAPRQLLQPTAQCPTCTVAAAPAAAVPADTWFQLCTCFAINPAVMQSCAGFERCKDKREALESYLRNREAFGWQPTSVKQRD